MQRTAELMEQRLAEIRAPAPAFSAALRAYRAGDFANGDTATADGLLAWLAGQPNVRRSAKRAAGIKGDIDHFGALSFLQGLLVILRDSGHPGLVLVLDEVETLQRVRGDVREKSLNALRQLIDEIDAGRFPGLYLVVTGTPAFFDGPQGVQRLPAARAAAARRLPTDASLRQSAGGPDPAAGLRPSTGFRLVGRKVRDLYADTASPRGAHPAAGADDAYVAELAAR